MTATAGVLISRSSLCHDSSVRVLSYPKVTFPLLSRRFSCVTSLCALLLFEVVVQCCSEICSLDRHDDQEYNLCYLALSTGALEETYHFLVFFFDFLKKL